LKNIRARAAKAIAPVLSGRGSLQHFDRELMQVPERDRAFFQELCFGTLRHFHALELLLDQLLKKGLKAKDADLRALMCIGLYQLRNLRVPDHAALSETAGGARALGKSWATGLVNAVLRNYLREADTLESKLSGNDAFVYLHPQWLLDELKLSWADKWVEVVEANNGQAPIYLRVNRRRIEVDSYLAKLAAQGVAAEKIEGLGQALKLLESHNPSLLPGYTEGEFSVQDYAAQLAAPLLQLESGQRVLDACCAPGGKTAHILELADNLSELVAIDREKLRIEKTGENLARLGLTATLLQADAADIATWWDGNAFDRILLDAPCSATGVIRRHPDIKLLRQESDLVNLVAAQAQLLDALWPCLAEGGLLLYATCSILPRENEEQIDRFCREHPDAAELEVKITAGEQRPRGRQLLPRRDSHDGFYYALLRKTA